ncbi:hypothetical protein GOODEAATRI_001519 [Goodea atripinnis]|uniref:Uncharacterized protein n=1 Tax=Goodea atripinnis TaxID=208336 RepID=A0ABV0PAI2_9TELE
MSESEDESGVMACRTRSKRPLRNVPLGQLEAELRAPDITPDMYDSSSAPEDRDWTDWLRGLLSSDVDNEEECDDEDDPEYNFLAEIDEPDQEDYRDDKAVRITSQGELIRAAEHPGFRSAFRASNLQGALELLEEMKQTPIDYQPQSHKPDGRGHSEYLASLESYEVSLSPIKMFFFQTLRNMEGACDPPKLVSQFLLRKTVVQVRRRILQCCRPGTPDNIVKAFRYQQVVWSMQMACGNVDPAEQRPPVAREENKLPLWLVCEAVQAQPGLSKQLLQVLDEFAAVGPSGAPEVLFSRLACLLRPWPQLLKDFAAFLNGRQARRCGLVSSLLRKHPDLQGEVQEIFQQLHTCSKTTDVDLASQNPNNGNSEPIDAVVGSDEDDEGEQQAVCAKNITVTSNGEKVIVWTR